MHSCIKTSLRQEVSGNSDRMDMTICVINESKHEIKFAGAVNSLVYFQNNKMGILKGDFFGIGGQMKDASGVNRLFNTQTLNISSPTTYYMFSDGFSDQFGGVKGRKFFAKNFRSLLLDIHKKPMEKQNHILQKTLSEWHGAENIRLDDVLVMGFKI